MLELDHVVCRKLSDAGVEIIVVYPTKIEFEWCEHICSYKNGTFYCGIQGVKPCDNIDKLDSNFLYELVGQLTDEQLDRVGNLIDLYEDRINYMLSQQEDMMHVGMLGTDMYTNLVAQLDDLTELKAMLETTFQTRNMEDYPFSIKQYILLGE